MLQQLHQHVTPTAKLQAVVNAVKRIVSLVGAFYEGVPEVEVRLHYLGD
jgi:hypothetical protein